MDGRVGEGSLQRSCPTCGQPTNLGACPHDGTATVHVGAGTILVGAGPVVAGVGPIGGGAAAAQRIGRVVGDRYRITQLVGRGGFGDVYRAQHIGTREPVALKVLRQEAQLEPGAIERFTAEARLSASLRHPNTVRVFDFGQTPDAELYLAMEFLEGGSLEDLVAGGKSLPARRVARIVAQVLKSLAEAHGKRIVHRDLKPENILVGDMAGEVDFVHVIDFGIAKFL
ncbi:MAG: serine/threonine protein kinase, partial [Myxococcales bacterium]|nr:serine/threonine protein kinase [Myxococcales bacterium]